MKERLVWIDCEMTGLDLSARRAHRGRRAGHRLRPQRARRRRRPRHQAARRGARPDGRLRPDDAREVRPAGRAGRRHDPRRGRAAGAGLREGALPRQHPASAGRQHRRHRPLVPLPRHAGPRGLPPLPDRRRLVDQGAGAAVVPRARTSRPRPSAATTGRWPTSRRASRSCATTARPSSSRAPARTATPRAPSRRSTAARSPACPWRRSSSRIPIPRNLPDSPTIHVGPGTSRGHMVGVAQLVERRVVVADVAGSSPVTHPKQSPVTKGAPQVVGAKV